MASKLLLAVLALSLLALVVDQAEAACYCTLVYYTLCERYDMSDIVVHAEVLSRTITGDNATYALDTITLYKGEYGTSYPDEISFVTPASSEDCGVTLEIGEEYLVGLNDADGDGQEFTVKYCHGVYELWSTVAEEIVECEVDHCAGVCDEFEECQLYQYDGNYYCSETCTDGVCEEGETCTTRKRKWCRNSGFLGCPMRRRCSLRR